MIQKHNFPSPCTSRTSQRLAVGLCALPYIPLSAPLRRTLFCYSFYFRRISAFFLHNQRKTANFAPCFQTSVSGFSFPPPLMAATIKGFLRQSKKNSVITEDCVVIISFIITLQRYCFFSIYANILATFLCEKSVFTHILIYINYYTALYCKA